MRQKKFFNESDTRIFDVAAAVAEQIRELESGHEEFVRKDAELNRLIDEAWKKGGFAREESPFPQNPPDEGWR